jgi:uncharacterized protein HemX
MERAIKSTAYQMRAIRVIRGLKSERQKFVVARRNDQHAGRVCSPNQSVFIPWNLRFDPLHSCAFVVRTAKSS